MNLKILDSNDKNSNNKDLSLKNNTIMKDLAIFGGVPTFTQSLCVNRPHIGIKQNYYKRLDAMFDSRIFTNDGPYVKELEKKIAHFLNVKHCILTCNGTMALQLICKALDLKGEVILPSFTFIATAHALEWQGLTPVFCDINTNTHNIDPESCLELINEKTAAILGVHLWGNGCCVNELETIAREHDIKLFFDAAHAFGCSYQNRPIGGFGDAEAFSFHATKAFSTFEGGAVTTNNDDLANRIKNFRNFGFIDYDCVDGLGINAKMPEVCAAMGLTNLEQFEETVQQNKKTHDHYLKYLHEIKGLSVMNYTEESNYQYVVVEVDKELLGVSRDELLMALHAENILVRKYFYPGCHNMEPYISRAKSNQNNLSSTEHLAQKLLVFPSGFGISKTVIKEIVNTIEIISNLSTEVKTHFS